MKWHISGNTFSVRTELYLIGCAWNGKTWISPFQNVKEKLLRLGINKEAIKKIKVEIILDKENLESILNTSGQGAHDQED